MGLGAINIQLLKSDFELNIFDRYLLQIKIWNNIFRLLFFEIKLGNSFGNVPSNFNNVLIYLSGQLRAE